MSPKMNKQVIHFFNSFFKVFIFLLPDFQLMAKSLFQSFLNPEMVKADEERSKNLSNNHHQFIEKSCSQEKNPKILFVKTFKTGST